MRRLRDVPARVAKSSTAFIIFLMGVYGLARLAGDMDRSEAILLAVGLTLPLQMTAMWLTSGWRLRDHWWRVLPLIGLIAAAFSQVVDLPFYVAVLLVLLGFGGYFGFRFGRRISHPDGLEQGRR